MIKLDINLIARNDLANIKIYFRDCFADDAYVKLEERIINALQHLISFPCSGSIVKIKKFKDYRYIIQNPYYIFYTFKNDTVTIQRIIHTSRNFKKLLKDTSTDN